MHDFENQQHSSYIKSEIPFTTYAMKHANTLKETFI